MYTLADAFFIATDDQAITLIIRKVAPDPAKENEELVPEANQGNQVNEHPQEPGEQPLKAELTFENVKINYGFVPANGCHRTLIVIPERLHGLFFLMTF